MKQSSIKISFILITVVFFNSCILAQTSVKTSKKEVDKWFSSNEWSGGLKLKVYDDVSKDEFYKQYHANKALWDKAFAFMKDKDLASLPAGKTLIAGDDLFATVTEAPDKDFDKTAWESHRKFIDLQYIIKGKEKMIVADTAKLAITEHYDVTKDAAHYTGEGKTYLAEPGTYYLFFPQNAHRPSIKVDGYDMVKKIVIKILAAK